MPAKVEGALAVSKRRKAIRVFLHVTLCLFLVLPIIASNVQGLSNFHKMKTSAESNVTILWTAPAAWGSGVAISDNGEYVAFVNESNLVLMSKNGQKILEIPLTDCVGSCKLYASELENIGISNDGTYIIVAHCDRIKIYKNTGELHFEYTGLLQPCSVSISKDGKIAVVGDVNSIYIFDIVNKKLIKHYLIGNVWSTAISDNGEYIACGCSDSTQNYVYVFNRNGEKIWEKSLSLGEYQKVERVQISNNGLLAVSCSDSVFVFDVLNDKLIFSRHTGDYTHPHVGVSPDGNYFVFAKEEMINNADTTYRSLVVSLYSKDGTEIWKKEVPRSEGAGYYGRGILGIRVSNNADWILVLGSGWGSPLVLFDKNGNEVFRYELPYYRFDLDMTPDGKYFAISGVTEKFSANSSIVFFQNNLVAERNQPPVADFTYTPQQPRVDEEITFDASSSYDPDGQIVEYEWDFGDGNIITTTEPVVTHVYTQAGSYTVTLTVTDNNGLSSSITKTIVIQRTDIYEYPEGYWNRTWFVILPGQEFKDENRVYVYSEKISQLNFYHKNVVTLDPYRKCLYYVYWYCHYKTSACPYDSPDYVGFVATRTVELDGGKYMITLGSDDGSRIWIDDKLIIDLWRDHHYIEVTKILNLSPGKHNLKIEYYNHIGGGKVKFEIRRIQSGGKVIYDRYWWDGYWMSNTSKCVGSCKLRENYTTVYPDVGFCSIILGSEAYLASDSGCYGICMYYGSFKVPSKGLYRITWKFNLTAKGSIRGTSMIGSAASASVAGVNFILERWVNGTVKDEKVNKTLIIYEISQPESLGDAITNAIVSHLISKALETILKDWSMFVPSISSYDEEYYKHMVYQKEIELEEGEYEWYVYPTAITASVAMGASCIASAGGLSMQLEEVKVELISPTLKEINLDNVPDDLEQVVSKYYDKFDWRTQAPTKQDTLNAIINAINQYFNTNAPSIRQQILNDIISLINLYFQL